MKKIGFLFLFSFLLSGCFFIKPNDPIPADQSQKGSLNPGQATCDITDSCSDERTLEKENQNLADLEIGDSVGGLTLQSKEIAQDYVAFHLTGKIMEKGIIKLYEDEMTDELLISFVPEKAGRTISISDGKFSNYSINLFEGNIEFASFDSQTRQALLGGQELNVELDITAFDHIGRFESEYYSNIEIDGYDIIE